MSLYSRSQLTSSLSSTACMCSILYSSAVCSTQEALERLARSDEHGRSNVGLTVHLGRQQCARMPSLLSPWHALSWCRRTSVRPPDDIEKSVTHRLHCAMPLSGNFFFFNKIEQDCHPRSTSDGSRQGSQQLIESLLLLF